MWGWLVAEIGRIGFPSRIYANVYVPVRTCEYLCTCVPVYPCTWVSVYLCTYLGTV